MKRSNKLFHCIKRKWSNIKLKATKYESRKMYRKQFYVLCSKKQWQNFFLLCFFLLTMTVSNSQLVSCMIYILANYLLALFWLPLVPPLFTRINLGTHDVVVSPKKEILKNICFNQQAKNYNSLRSHKVSKESKRSKYSFHN